MKGGEAPGVEVGRVRRVVLVRALPDTEATPDHTVHLVTLPSSIEGPPGADSDGSAVSGLCGTRLQRGRIETVAVGEGVWCTLCFAVHVTGVGPAPDAAGEPGAWARVEAVLAYRELGWPVAVRAGQVSLNLDLDLDAVAVVIPAEQAARVGQILDARRCPPAMLTHPALPAHRVIVAGERYGVTLGWPSGVHRVTGTLLLPPSLTEHGPLRWVRPPRQHSLRLCREIDVCAAVTTALREPPSNPIVF